MSQRHLDPEPAPVRILIVDDHKLLGEAIRWALESHGMQIIGIAEDRDQALQIVSQEHPDLVLLDIGLPRESGLTVGNEILERFPETKVVVLTALVESRTVGEVMRAGFHGYITKDTAVPQLIDSVKAALNGQVVVPRRLAPAAAGAVRPEEREARLLADQLTPREKEVLALLVRGARSDEISQVLKISPNTVRTHVQNVLTKLQVRSRLEAAAFAVRTGVVEVQRDAPITRA